MDIRHFAPGLGTLERDVLGHGAENKQVLGDTGEYWTGKFLTKVKICLNLPSTNPGYVCLHSIINRRPFSLSKVLWLDDGLYAILPLIKDILLPTVEPRVRLRGVRGVLIRDTIRRSEEK